MKSWLFFAVIFLSIQNQTFAYNESETNITSATLIGLSHSTTLNKIQLSQSSAESESLAVILSYANNLEVTLKEGSYTHAINYMGKHPNTCIRNLIKNHEREQYLHFSKPQLLILGKRFYLNTKFAQLFNPNIPESISFDELSKVKPNFILGIEQGRTYGKALDKMIEKLPNKNKYLKSKGDEESVLFTMLQRKRIDLLLASPSTMKFFGEKYQVDDIFESIAISSMLPILKSHIACSKTPEGKAIIGQFNQAIQQAYKDPAYLQVLMNWVEPQNRDLYYQYFQQNMKTD